MAEKNIFKAENVSKQYSKGAFGKASFAVRDLTFEIAKGEVFGFIGANGAGKSTTIKMIVGAIAPTSGRMSLNGEDVARFSARRGLAFVPENPWLNDSFTPLEVLEMGVRISGVSVPKVKEHCRYWLERFGLDQAANRRLKTFSKGMVQRTVLAHALALKPHFLLLDEPLSGLDPLGRREVVDILDEYRRDGGTIFMTSHVLHDVERLADRFGLIHQGQMLAIKTPADLREEGQMALIRSMGTQCIEGFRADPGGRWSAEVEMKDLWRVLDALHVAGHQLLEVRPGLSLERSFLKLFEKDRN